MYKFVDVPLDNLWGLYQPFDKDNQKIAQTHLSLPILEEEM